MATPLKVLIFDIETAPIRAFAWRVWRENISVDQIISNSYMITWAAKWYDKPTIKSDHLYPSEIDREDDSRIVESLAELIREADVLVAHNLDGFDWPVVNTRVAKHHLEPLGVQTHIDTLKLAKKNFRFPHNKLDYLADFFGIGRKIKTDFQLWAQVVGGDETAMRKMVKYNKHDVKVLEGVFDAMKKYVKRLGRLFDASSMDEYACPTCGTEGNFQRRGFYRTQSGNFIKLQCKTCGRYHRRRNTVKRFGVHPL